MKALKGKSILKLAVLPGIFPRCRELFRSGFRHIAYLLASLYGAMNLLPAGHPYLNARNIGRYGILNVIGEASNHLVVRKDNIDKIIMFVVTIIGMVLLFMQFVVLALAVVMAPALATAGTPLSFADIFTTTNNETDLAFIGLDMVFGVPGIFDSCIALNTPCSSDPTQQILQGTGTFPWPFHQALHSMFQIYSLGLLVVAVMILIYFVIAIIAETAQSGTPFGRRFNKVWAPLRLVVALGLLVPMASGLNSAQYITLYAANLGSSMATNAWLNFQNTISTASAITPPSASPTFASGTSSGNTILGNNAQLISKPNPPKVQGFLQFLHVAKTCEIVEEAIGYRVDESIMVPIETRDIRMYAVRDNNSPPPSGPSAPSCSYAASDTSLELDTLSGGSLAAGACAFHFFNGGDIVIKIGERNRFRYPERQGNVSPICGEFVVPFPNPNTPGAFEISWQYLTTVEDLFNNPASSPIPDFQTTTIDNFIRPGVDLNGISTDPALTYSGVLSFGLPGLKYEWTNRLTQDTKTSIVNAYNAALIGLDLTYNVNMQEKGWAAAGIWYNRIAEINGLFMDAVMNYPYPTAYPQVMEYIAEERRKVNENADGDPYSRETSEKELEFEDNKQYQEKKYHIYYNVYRYWSEDPVTGSGAWNTSELVGHIDPDGNPIIRAINFIFGTAGLFDMRENADVHPLAQLSGLGKGIMNATIVQLGAGLGGIAMQFGGSLIGNSFVAQAGGVISGFTFSIASIGMTAAFILYYVLPFLPFIYFFFAVIGWIKGIFEAMVGVPLWALAHIRIDGEGLPGEAAVNGYFLILEIIIRPILILFGLMASITIFAAAVQVLNDIFELVVSNLAGFNDSHADGPPGVTDVEFYRDPIDQFFYTIIYAVICYLLAQSTFKMIDTIPNQILRWAGQSVQTFNDQREDPAQGLTQYAAIGGVQVFGQGVGALQQAGQGAAGLGRALRETL